MPTESLPATSCPPEAAFVDLLAGRLAGPDAERVEGHVAACSACGVLLGELSSLATHETATTTAKGTEDVLAREVLRGGARAGAASRAGTTLDRKYRLLGLLGRGGMGAVYEAEHTGTGRRVAVKLIHGHLLERSQDAESRFRREARAAGATDSPHIVAILDAGEDEATGDPYLVMEHLRGEDLQHLVDRVGPLPPDVVLRIAAQALAGLAKAHEAGIVHRDIKPANLFLARSDEGEITVKLLDFGIAKVKPEALRLAHTAGLTETGGLLGSPLYMSPEQMQSSRSVDHRTDLWSLGSALHCALTGRAPFHHVENVLDLALAVRSSEGPPPVQKLAPWVPPEAAEVVRRALAVNPEQRWPSAAAMLASIRGLLPGGVALREDMLAGVSPEVRAAARAPSPPPRAPRDRRRLRLGALGAAAIAVVVAAGYARLRSPALHATPLPPVETGSPSVAAAPSSTPAPPAPADPLRRVTVQVSPEDASVEVDGAPADVRGGAFEIAGAPGSGHRVRVSRGESKLTTEVFVTEKGAVPPRVELASPRPVAAAPPASVTGRAAPRAPPHGADSMRRPE